jgi:hypothetical protein
MWTVVRNTGEAGKKLFSNDFNGIGRGFRHDPAVARSDIKAKKILNRCEIGSLHSFAKTVVPGAGFVGGGEISLERVFLHLQEDPSGIEPVSIEVRTGREKMRAAILGFERRARGLRGRAPPPVRLTFNSPSAHLILTRAQGECW